MAVCRGCGQNLCTQAGVSMPEQTKPLMEKDKSLGGGDAERKGGPSGQLLARALSPCCYF